MSTWNVAEADRIRRTSDQFGLDPSLILPKTYLQRPGGASPPPVVNGGRAQSTTTTTSTPTSATPPAAPLGLPAINDPVLYQGKRYKVVGFTNGQADLEPLP